MMHAVCDILAYVVVAGFELAALCAITRVGRGWLWQSVGFAVLLVVYGILAWWDMVAGVSFLDWVPLGFALISLAFIALVFALSRGTPGRRAFLSIGYISYSTWYLPVFHLIAYRNVFGLAELPACLVGLALVTAANLAFLFWLHRWAPRADPGYNWWGAACVAGVAAASLYVCGIWPISIISAPLRYCSAFVWAALMTWVLFPQLLRILNVFSREAALARGLAILKTEAKRRRDSVELARQMRHDQRHHSAQLLEYLRRGQSDKAIAYLEKMENTAENAARNRILWCENEVVSAILASCARKARSKGVTLIVVADVGPALPFEDAELVVVLANLLENALNEVGKVGSPSCAASPTTEGRGGVVKVGLRQQDFGLGIQIANPVPKGFALSPKGLPCAAPGLGLESVRQVVDKYHGTWKYTLEEDLLVCLVTLRAR